MTIAIHKGTKGEGIWCDRRSPLGNPFHLQAESQRDAVCDAYQEYFHLIVDRGYSPSNAAWQAADRFGLGITDKWHRPDRAEFLAALDRLDSLYQQHCAIALKCWCINAMIKSRADLMQPKRCHCLSLAGHLLPDVSSFSEQISLGI